MQLLKMLYKSHIPAHFLKAGEDNKRGVLSAYCAQNTSLKHSEKHPDLCILHKGNFYCYSPLRICA